MVVNEPPSSPSVAMASMRKLSIVLSAACVLRGDTGQHSMACGGQHNAEHVGVSIKPDGDGGLGGRERERENNNRQRERYTMLTLLESCVERKSGKKEKKGNTKVVRVKYCGWFALLS